MNTVSRFLADLPLTMEVDDVLIRGKTVEEAIERFKQFLLRSFCEQNIKLARRKLQFGTTIDFLA